MYTFQTKPMKGSSRGSSGLVSLVFMSFLSFKALPKATFIPCPVVMGPAVHLLGGSRRSWAGRGRGRGRGCLMGSVYAGRHHVTVFYRRDLAVMGLAPAGLLHVVR